MCERECVCSVTNRSPGKAAAITLITASIWLHCESIHRTSEGIYEMTRALVPVYHDAKCVCSQKSLLRAAFAHTTLARTSAREAWFHDLFVRDGIS